MIAKNSGIRYLRQAFKVEGLRGPVRAVFLEISSYTNAAGIAYPGMKRIAVRSGYSRKTVERATEELEARGLLRRIRRKSDRGLQGYIFAVVLPIRLLVESDGHKVSKRADTKSGHNYTLELLKELEGTGQADFQEAIFGILKDRIDLSGNRDLFSLAPIPRLFAETATWLFKGCSNSSRALVSFNMSLPDKVTSWKAGMSLSNFMTGASEPVRTP